MGAPVAKAYLPIAGRPVILHTLARFAATRTVTTAVIVVADRDLERFEAILRAEDSAGRQWVLEAGGPTRRESVRRGLQKITSDCDLVVIHDGVRPFVSSSLIDRCVHEAQEKGAVVAGLPARDTVKIVSETGRVQATPERRSLWEIQTPQVFRRELILKAHQWARDNNVEATDDAALVERLGEAVYVLEGERTNIKLTFPEDLLLAEALIREGRIPG
jgi:2-C-methyl-D-erythritol 4-phosphate cytidylyltransferase